MVTEIIKSTILSNSWLIDNYRDSMRRHFVDDFYFRHIEALPAGSDVLDLGGNKIGKRGLFRINKYQLNVVYANYSLLQRPDVRTDACFLPFVDNCFTGVICAEILEHIKNPVEVLAEVNRVLVTNGTLFITVPFMFPIHSDPSDYGRYTHQFWSESLTDIGFERIRIEWQGGFWCVFTDMIRGIAMDREEMSRGTIRKILFWVNKNLQGFLKKKALQWDRSGDSQRTFFVEGCTTGFGIMCQKK